MSTPVFVDVQVGASDGAITVVSATVTGVANQLYIATVHTDRGSAPSVTGITGMGLTWTLVKAQCSGLNEHRVEIWRALGTPSGDGAVTATLSIEPLGAYISVSRWSGVAVLAPVGASSGYNTNGSGGACSGGVDTDDATGSVSVQVPGSVVLTAVSTDEDFSHTAGWTAAVTNGLSSGAGTVQASVEYKIVTAVGAVTVGAANNIALADDWALAAVEIVGPAVPNSMMMMGVGG